MHTTFSPSPVPHSFAEKDSLFLAVKGIIDASEKNNCDLLALLVKI